MRTALLPAVTLAAILVAGLTGCGHDSTSAATPPSNRPTGQPASGTASGSSTPDPSACRAQLRAGSRIANRARLSRLPLAQFHLRSNDLQEVLEEARHVCPLEVVLPLKASSLRLLTADEYLLTCAPARTCRPARLRRLLSDVERLQRRAEEAFSG